ncbi:MAG: hypothetical protein GF347_00540 [Candidatus Moranbacteria bacterium]|nr:hypothetical protein [Candidatus Moranbacteria bacterium]
MRNKFLIFGLMLTFCLAGCGCSKERSLEKQRIKELGLGKEIEVEINQGEDGKVCESEDLKYEWPKRKKLSLEFSTNIGSRGSKFKETRAFLKEDDTIELFIIEDFCEKDCASVKKEQCSNFILEGVKEGDYKVNVHLTEELTNGGVVKKFEVSASE